MSNDLDAPPPHPPADDPRRSAYLIEFRPNPIHTLRNQYGIRSEDFAPTLKEHSLVFTKDTVSADIVLPPEDTLREGCIYGWFSHCGEQLSPKLSLVDDSRLTEIDTPGNGFSVSASSFLFRQGI